MSLPRTHRKSRDIVLLAARDITTAASAEFSEWDLSVAAWRREPTRFGMRGYEEQHPDHKRVMKEIMGKAVHNPVQRGYLDKVRPNTYRLTALGRAELATIDRQKAPDGSRASAASELYDDMAKFAEHRVFEAWLKDSNEPRTWLAASAFLGLSKNESNELTKRLSEPTRLAEEVLRWCRENQRDSLTRGPVGGGRPITSLTATKMSQFVALLQERFGLQMRAIRERR